jgi:nicotinamidase/pyrazinamidase
VLLWDVDTQIDFLLPGGRLYVPGAESIIPNLARLSTYALDHHLPLISSACAHLSGDPELEIYGPHCMAGTPGQQKVQETLLPSRYVLPNRLVELPPLKAYQQIIIEKQEFDVFTNPNSDYVLQRFGSALRIVLYGVVTEICVASAARALLDRGHKVILVGDAVHALDPTKGAVFVDELLNRGGQLTTVAEVAGLRV